MMQRDVLGEEAKGLFLRHCQCSFSKTFLAFLRPVTYLIGEFGARSHAQVAHPLPLPLSWSQAASRERCSESLWPCLVREDCAAHPCRGPGR